MRLLIDPGRADQAGSNAAVVLTYRTKVSETVSGVVVERQPTEAVKTVLRSQLEQMIRAYPGDDPAFGNMVVDERHGAQRSLRCAVARLFAAHGNLPDATLRGIFTPPLLAGFEWIAAPAATPAQAAAAAPQSTDAAWTARWNSVWGYIYRNSAGALVQLDPAATQTAEERAGAAGGAPLEEESESRATTFVAPAAAHGVPAADSGPREMDVDAPQ